MATKKGSSSASGSLLELVLIVAVALGLALGIQAFLVKPYRIPSESMVPTLQVGQRVLVNRIGERFTKPDTKKTLRMMRHRKDTVFDSACMMLDQEKRRCTVYEARPGVCRKYPDSTRCGYYDFLRFEREQQGDEEMVALT